MTTHWLTPKEAGEYSRQSKDLIHSAVKSGELPAYKIGKGSEYRLTAEDVDAWMKSRAWEPRSA
jgi:excisionase family DNA binding protein